MASCSWKYKQLDQPIYNVRYLFNFIYGVNLQIFSNGLYKSIEHRATVNSVKERISVAMFFKPKLESEVGPSTTLINPKNPPLFKRVGVEKYFKDFFSRKLNGKSYLEQMRIGNENGEDHNTLWWLDITLMILVVFIVCICYSLKYGF